MSEKKDNTVETPAAGLGAEEQWRAVYRCRLCGDEFLPIAMKGSDPDLLAFRAEDASDLDLPARIHHVCESGDLGICEFSGCRRHPMDSRPPNGRERNRRCQKKIDAADSHVDQDDAANPTEKPRGRREKDITVPDELIVERGSPAPTVEVGRLPTGGVWVCNPDHETTVHIPRASLESVREAVDKELAPVPGEREAIADESGTLTEELRRVGARCDGK